MTDYDLSPRARADLQWLCAHLVEATAAALGGVTSDEPVVAVCLYYSVDHPTLLEPGAIFLCTEEQRLSIVERYGEQAATEAWNFSEWIPGLEASLADDVRSDEFVEREQRLVGELERAGCAEPARFVLNRVARSLMGRTSWSFATREPFVIYVFDASFGERLVENLAFVCDDDTRDQLVSAGLWPGDADGA